MTAFRCLHVNGGHSPGEAPQRCPRANSSGPSSCTRRSAERCRKAARSWGCPSRPSLPMCVRRHPPPSSTAFLLPRKAALCRNRHAGKNDRPRQKTVNTGKADAHHRRLSPVWAVCRLVVPRRPRKGFVPFPPPRRCCQLPTFFILEALGVCWGLQLPTAAPRATR
jgi:hypothetical protein